jgi:hypothetical protein
MTIKPSSGTLALSCNGKFKALTLTSAANHRSSQRLPLSADNEPVLRFLTEGRGEIHGFT